MARDHARIQCDIWNDEDFRGLSTLAKLLYVQLLSQPKLSYAGLLDLAAKRWARAHPDHTVAEVRAALAELDAARMLVVDHDTEEVLVRTLVRNDGIYKQPQVLAAALRQAFEIESPILRSALAVELRRLPVEVCGDAPSIAAHALETGSGQLPEAARTVRRKAKGAAIEPQPTSGDQAADELTHPSPNPVDNPSDDPSAQAQGVGGRGNVVRSPLTLGRSSLGSAARPRACRRTRAEASRLVASTVPAQPRRVTDRLVSEAAALLAEGITSDRVGAGLRRWCRKRVGAGLLPELVAEAMREPGNPMPATTDDGFAAALALARKVAIEDQDETELGRILRTADDETALAALLGVAA